MQSRAEDDPVEWITSTRRRGGGAWRSLPPVRPAGSQFPVDEIVDQVPAGIAYIQLSLHALTSTVTALTAEFALEDDQAQGLEGILNQEFATRAEMLPNRGHTILRVENQKASAARGMADIPSPGGSQLARQAVPRVLPPAGARTVARHRVCAHWSAPALGT
jgi:hypothetical protein